MSHHNFLEIQTTQPNDAVSGFWKLAPGRVVSLQPRQTGTLRVAQGQVWATLDASHRGAGNELGDYFLQAGEHLVIQPGQHLVLEPMEGTVPQAAFFEWVPAVQRAQAHSAVHANGIAQPLRDLGLALGMAGTAVMELCTGLLAFGRQSVRSRPVAVHGTAHCG